MRRPRVLELTTEYIKDLSQNGFGDASTVQVIAAADYEDQIKSLFEIVDKTVLPRSFELSLPKDDIATLLVMNRGIISVDSSFGSNKGAALSIYWALEDVLSSGKDISVTSQPVPFDDVDGMQHFTAEQIKVATDPSSQFQDLDDEGDSDDD